MPLCPLWVKSQHYGMSALLLKSAIKSKMQNRRLLRVLLGNILNRYRTQGTQMLCPPLGPAMSAISTAFGGKAAIAIALFRSF